jgi:hypothetical protein
LPRAPRKTNAWRPLSSVTASTLTGTAGIVGDGALALGAVEAAAAGAEEGGGNEPARDAGGLPSQAVSAAAMKTTRATMRRR